MLLFSKTVTRLSGVRLGKKQGRQWAQEHRVSRDKPEKLQEARSRESWERG